MHSFLDIPKALRFSIYQIGATASLYKAVKSFCITRGNVWPWIFSTHWAVLTAVVPDNSILTKGPFLFLININDRPDGLSSSEKGF